MATESLINPFSDYGTAVRGDRFVGRAEELRTIEDRVLGANYGNLSIVGLPKVGKSSLVQEGIINREETLAQEKTAVVYYQIGSTRNALKFFQRMATYLNDFFEEYFPDDSQYREFALPIVKEICDSGTTIDNVTDLLSKYYKRLRRWGYKIIYVLDEFDHAQNIFDGEDFQALRELSYEPKSKICIVTCSRKSLEDLEKKTTGLSVFAQTFSVCDLQMFNKIDIKSYWERVKPLFKCDNVERCSAKVQTAVDYLVGGHPWLMDMLNDHYFNNGVFAGNESALEGDFGFLMEALEHIIKILKEDSLLDTAIQLSIGPCQKEDPIIVQKLKKYGYIRAVTREYKDTLFGGYFDGPLFNGKAYTCFSDFAMLDLYRRYYANVPYSTLWSSTENDLRGIIISYINDVYGEDWQSKMETYLTNNPPHAKFVVAKWKSNLASLSDLKAKMSSAFPSMSSNHLVEFTLTPQIFDIFIRPAWKQWFCNVFTGSDYQTWNAKFEHLTKVRNPICHNNIGIPEHDIEIAHKYCIEVRKAIEEWYKQHPE